MLSPTPLGQRGSERTGVADILRGGKRRRFDVRVRRVVVVRGTSTSRRRGHPDDPRPAPRRLRRRVEYTRPGDDARSRVHPQRASAAGAPRAPAPRRPVPKLYTTAERPRYLRPSAARAPARFRTAPVPTRIQRAGSAVAAARAPALRAGSESGATRAGSRPRPRAPLPGAAPVALPPRPRGRSDAGAPASGTAQRLLILYTLHTHADIRVRLGPQRGQAVKTARH